jgi:hypothetical protein
MRRSIIALSAAALLTLGACSTAAPTAEPGPTKAAVAASTNDAVIADLGFAGKSGQEIVNAIDSSTDARPLPFGASVRGSELILTKDNQEAKVALPADSFYLSVAPYQSQTHECYFHSLATCRGELAQQDVTVTIKDASGKVLVDEQGKTYTNGFIGFWLPRDIQGTVTIEHEGHRGTVEFATTEGSPTCLTTLQMA